MSITKEKKSELMKEFGISGKDTGSPEVQVAVLTDRIRNLTEHLKDNKKDNSCKMGLTKMVGQRKRLLAYIKRKDPAKYDSLIKKLGLRK